MSGSTTASAQWYICNPGDTHARGPFALAQLQELGEVGLVTAGTLIVEAGAANWSSLSDWPDLAASVLPQKRAIQLQPEVQFEAVNTDRQEPAPDVGTLLQENVASWREAELAKPIQFSEPPGKKKFREFCTVFALGAAGVGLGWLLFPASPLTNTGLLSFLAIWGAAWAWILFFVLS